MNQDDAGAPIGFSSTGDAAALFEPSRHEPLGGRRWDEGVVEDLVVRVARDAERAYSTAGLWPAHSLDTEGADDDVYRMLYFGAAGVIWALDRLQQLGAIELERNYAAELEPLIEPNQSFGLACDSGTASLFWGDTGILLTQYRLRPEARVADALEKAIADNIDHRARELTWGAPGTMLASLSMLEHTGEARWRELFLRSADGLWQQLEPCPSRKDILLWNQLLHLKYSLWCIGAGHGFAGNVAPLLRGMSLLASDRATELVNRIEHTLVSTVYSVDGLSNWPSYLPPLPEVMRGTGRDKRFLVHFCHGAPGVVLSLAALPPGESLVVDALLLEAGELVWRAGPLQKGPGLCHGTAGNGYVFLALWKRTGDDRWLERARAFAMHTVDQIDAASARDGRRRWSLWTGDLGALCFLWDCVSGRSEFPTFDVF